MIEAQERPVTVAVHPKLEFELKERKRQTEKLTERPVKGGLTTYSRLAAFELEAIRKSGDELIKEILKMKDIQTHKIEINGTTQTFVAYADFKKLYIFLSILNKKKDQKQIHVDITKIRGLKKNEANIFW
jgi:hypothetical protein